jgi:hypothetical protein
MTRDEIIKMARVVRDGGHWNQLDLLAFGRIIALAEREACAKVCDDYEDWCDTWGQDDKHMAAVSAASELAQAIRSRGEK